MDTHSCQQIQIITSTWISFEQFYWTISEVTDFNFNKTLRISE